MSGPVAEAASFALPDVKHVVGASTWRSLVRLDWPALISCVWTAGSSSRNAPHAIVPTARGIQISRKIYRPLASSPVKNAQRSLPHLKIWEMVIRSERKLCPLVKIISYYFDM